jgi:hypothetical protein
MEPDNKLTAGNSFKPIAIQFGPFFCCFKLAWNQTISLQLVTHLNLLPFSLDPFLLFQACMEPEHKLAAGNSFKPIAIQFGSFSVDLNVRNCQNLIIMAHYPET